jgi:F-type H+-transporting ATPase subunit b
VLIDWFTVLAQIVNFLILVALMRRFLYGPLVAAIDAREKSIADRLAAALERESAAEAHAAEADKAAAEIESQKGCLLAAAREDADRRRGEILTEARVGIRALEARWRAELERGKTAFLEEVRRRAAEEILAATRSALRDLASADLDRSAFNVLLQKLGTLDPARLRMLSADGATVVSREELPEARRGELQRAIERQMGSAVTIRFECTPALAWGIELRGGGQRIGWTPDAWLDSVEDKLRSVLDQAARETTPAAA